MPKKILFIFSLICFFTPLISFAQEETINIVTTYPSPAGIYDQLLGVSFAARTLGVGDNNGDASFNASDAPDPATESGQAWIASEVGIGTNAPGVLFHASGDSSASGEIIAIVGSGTTVSDVQLAISQDAGRSRIELQAKQAAGAASRMLLLNPDGGRVGIGTSAPGAKLKVGGDVRVSGVVNVNVAGAGAPGVIGAACSNAGAIGINAGNRFVGCNGTNWLALD